MDRDGGKFLMELSSFGPRTFEGRFAMISVRLGLGAVLSATELRLLYQAAFYAKLCNIAFNGLGRCGGYIIAEKERHRIVLENKFMVARDAFFASVGWSVLAARQRESIDQALLQVAVAESNLAR